MCSSEWKITFLVEFPASSWSAELACVLMLHVLWVRSNSAGCTWVILGWFCVLHPETPSTVIPVRLVFSSYSLDGDVLRVFPLLVYKTTVFFNEHRCYIRLVIVTFFLPWKKKKKKIITWESSGLLLSRCLGWAHVKVTRGWVCFILMQHWHIRGSELSTAVTLLQTEHREPQGLIPAIPFVLTAVALALALFLPCLQVSKTDV